MHALVSGKARVPARTLLARAGGVFMWPVIALTERRGAACVPIAADVARFWISRLHGSKADDWAVLRCLAIAVERRRRGGRATGARRERADPAFGRWRGAHARRRESVWDRPARSALGGRAIIQENHIFDSLVPSNTPAHTTLLCDWRGCLPRHTVIASLLAMWGGYVFAGMSYGEQIHVSDHYFTKDG
jgi:hypothetical protein